MTLLLENISLTIGDVLLVKSFTISIEAGEIVTLMGPSGCGKSSILAYIAGDLTASACAVPRRSRLDEGRCPELIAGNRG